MIALSPSLIYFSHSRLDTKFSGCGKDIATTLAEVLSGQTRLEAIPVITVLEVEGRHVSLNNRRLYLFKELQRLGRLPGGVVPCRSQKPTPKEVKKYAGATLALSAKLTKCGPAPRPGGGGGGGGGAAGAAGAAAAAAAAPKGKVKGKVKPAEAEAAGGGGGGGGGSGAAAAPEPAAAPTELPAEAVAEAGAEAEAEAEGVDAEEEEEEEEEEEVLEEER